MNKDDHKRWLADGMAHGWSMPTAPWWKRLPIIRRFRAAWAAGRVAEHDAFYGRLGLIRTGYDRWVLWGIAHGFERPASAPAAEPLAAPTCRRCATPLQRGVFTAQTFVGGMSDFPGDPTPSTYSAGGPGRLAECWKCPACGWSVT